MKCTRTFLTVRDIVVIIRRKCAIIIVFDAEKPSDDVGGRANLKLLDEESGRWRIEQKSMRNCLYLIVKMANYCFLHNNQLNDDGQTSTVLRLAESDRSSSSSSFGPARFVLAFRLPLQRLKHSNVAANARWSQV
jgi:hypothetical protein